MHTLVLGATTNPARVAYQAIHRLVAAGYPVSAVGIKHGEVAGIPIQHGEPSLDDIHTVTLYVGPQRQVPYYDYLLRLAPNRIIFNPGTENPELIQLARKHDIEPEVACTLVMLATGSYAAYQ